MLASAPPQGGAVFVASHPTAPLAPRRARGACRHAPRPRGRRAIALSRNPRAPQAPVLRRREAPSTPRRPASAAPGSSRPPATRAGGAFLVACARQEWIAFWWFCKGAGATCAAVDICGGRMIAYLFASPSKRLSAATVNRRINAYTGYSRLHRVQASQLHHG